MYTQRIIRVPAVGKIGELRTAMLERTKAASSTVPHSLGEQMWAAEPAFIHLSRYENLTDFDAHQERNQSDPFVQDTMNRINQSLARSASSELYEILIPRQGGGDPPKFSLGI